jgi:two-component system, NarL family, nitrate/nitrite response regulator NarL
VRRTRVLVADPVRIFRAGVRNLLRREHDFEVIEAAELADLEALTDDCPDIALIDLQFPPFGAVTALNWLRNRCDAYTIVWSLKPSREAVLDALGAGADGYLCKEISRAGLVRSLRGAAQGEAALSRELTMFVVEELRGLEQRDRTRERIYLLSSREREILHYVAQGLRNRQIAATLSISEYTVKRHIQNILGKLDLASRVAAAEFYREAVGGGRAAVGA